MTKQILLALALTSFALGQVAKAPEPIDKPSDRAKAEPTEKLIARLNADYRDGAAIDLLAQRPGPDVIAALRNAFLVARQGGAKSTASLRWSQIIAGTLMQLGLRDQVYFDELAKYVRAAIQANPPEAEVWEEPKPIDTSTGLRRLSPQYYAWCGRQGLQGEPCTLALVHYSSDISVLAGTRDEQALPILRTVLTLSDSSLVSTAVSMLSQLGDEASLPAMAAACHRFPPKQAESIGYALVYFPSPAMLPVLDRCVHDAKLKAALVKEWEEKRKAVKQ